MSSAVILEPADLDKLIKAITDTVREELSKVRKENSDVPLTRKEAARYFGIDVGTMHKKFKSGELPASLRHRVGGRIVFFKSELEAYLKKS